eukprot:Partr_v1_DN26958_c0_g1_i10_m7031 putative pelota homolog
MILRICGISTTWLCLAISCEPPHSGNFSSTNDTRLFLTSASRLQTVSSTGSTDSQRVRITITIAVESMDFDASTCSIRVNGKVVEENEHVKMGAYHTIDLELHRNLTITKEEWDSIALDRIATACDITKRAEIAAVVLQDGLCLQWIFGILTKCLVKASQMYVC